MGAERTSSRSVPSRMRPPVASRTRPIFFERWIAMAHAFSYDFSAHFKAPAEKALDRFRAREDADEALAAQALPVNPGERQAYVLCKSAPEVAAAEVEQSGVEALEITILWG